jgi:signal transduction histidine kinase
VRVRETRSRADQLRMEAAAARADAEAVARQAVQDERVRIARELHDAVGHAVNVMVMQAGAARLLAQDERTAEALRNIERVGRASLSDLDAMLGLLTPSDDDPGAPLEPAHRLSDVADLVARVRSSDLRVALRDETAGRVPPDLDGRVAAATYRIVQESLTNISKHAGPTSAEVVLRASGDELVVSVLDDGLGAAASPSPGGGRGIAGMRERVHVLGGRLEVGPRPGGGFAVEARIPLEDIAR